MTQKRQLVGLHAGRQKFRRPRMAVATRWALQCLILTAVIFPLKADGAWILGEDISWNVSTDPAASPMMTFSIFDVDLNFDILVGWQVRLFVLPDNLATGTLHFDSPAVVVGADYLLDGRSGGLGGSVDPMDPSQLFAFDDDSTFQGVVVPFIDPTIDPLPGNALTVKFVTPDAARGTFSIWAIGAPGDTQWADHLFRDQAFDNVPFFDVRVVGSVTVVPESVSLGCLLLWLVSSMRSGWHRKGSMRCGLAERRANRNRNRTKEWSR